MCNLIGRQAPAFTAQAVLPDGSIRELSLTEYAGKYVVLFFYPLDFTFVCPTEILDFSRKVPDFKERGAEVIGVSVDSQYSHFAWRETPVDRGGIGPVRLPLVADLGKRIASDYGVLDVNGNIALRATFLIDRKGVVRHAVINDPGLGRNIDEELRTLDALKHVEKYGEVCPANWHQGDEAVKPTAAGVAAYLSKHG